MVIDIIVGIIASAIFISLLIYFVLGIKKRKRGCAGCAQINKYKKSLKKAHKEINKDK